jgi:hypothetical protein
MRAKAVGGAGRIALPPGPCRRLSIAASGKTSAATTGFWVASADLDRAADPLGARRRRHPGALGEATWRCALEENRKSQAAERNPVAVAKVSPVREGSADVT